VRIAAERFGGSAVAYLKASLELGAREDPVGIWPNDLISPEKSGFTGKTST